MATKKQSAAPSKDGPSASAARIIGTVTMQQGDTVEREWLRALQGPKRFEVYREMLDNDGTIGGAFFQGEALAVQNDYPVRPAKQTKDEDWDYNEAERWAEFVEECRDDMEHRWSQFISEGYYAFPMGFAVHEIAFKNRLGRDQKDATKYSRFSDGMIGWRGFYHRPQASIEKWRVEKQTGVVQGLKQRSVKEEIPRESFLLTNIRPVSGDPTGNAALRHIYVPSKRKTAMEEIEVITYERGPGMPVIRLPARWFSAAATSEEKSSLAEFAKQSVSIRIGERMGVCFPSSVNDDNTPSGFEIDWKGPSQGGYGPIREAIIDYRNVMLTAIGMQFLMLGQNEHGSFSLADIESSMAERIIESIMWSILEEPNERAIPLLMQYNGAPEKYWPNFEPGDIAKAPLAKFAESLPPLIQCGAITRGPHLEKYICDKTGLPMPEAGLGAYEVKPKPVVPENEAGTKEPTVAPESPAAETDDVEENAAPEGTE